MKHNHTWGPRPFTVRKPGAGPLFCMILLRLQIAFLRLRFGLTEAHAQALAALIWGAVQ